MAKENNLIKRYPPNSRFNYGAFKDQVQVPIIIDDFGESVTDKESYRLSLASKRGSIATIGSNSYQQGEYMFPDGKYELSKDFSFVMRKDLSIVEIDDYIDKMKSIQKEADESLMEKINVELAKATAAKEKLQKKETENNSEYSE